MFRFRWRRSPVRAATARGLITDPAGRWLIVRPVGRGHWQLPGGRLDRGESPTAACRRELREELGVDLVPGPLIAVTWRPNRFVFVFDMGRHESLPVRLPATELAEWRWAAPAEALPSLKKDVAEAMTRAGADHPTAVYVES